MQTHGAFVLLLLAVAVSAQQILLAGSFQGANPVKRDYLACFNNEKKAWNRNPTFSNFPSKSVILSETETYYPFLQGNYMAIMYQQGSNLVPVNGREGLIYSQSEPNATISPGTISALYINAARTRVWVFGLFTHVGTTKINPIATNGFAAVGFDVSKSKTNPTLVEVPVPATLFTSPNAGLVYTQGLNFLIVDQNMGKKTMNRANIVQNAWNYITNFTQDATAAKYKVSPDETLYAYTDNGPLSSPYTPLLPTYAYLSADSSVFVPIMMNYTFFNPSIAVTPSTTKWAPTDKKEIYFVFESATIVTTQTNDLKIQKDKILQYIYKVTEGTSPVVASVDRISSSTSAFPSLTNTIDNLVYNDKIQHIMISGSFTFVIKGDYQSVYPNPITNDLPLNRRNYRLVPITTNRALLNLNTGAFDPFFGGSGPYSGGLVSLNNYVSLPGVNFTCFYEASSSLITYDTFTPTIMSYQKGVFTQVPLLSGLFDHDPLTASDPIIKAIERIDSNVGTDFYAGGEFGTINNVSFNSIVKYTVNAGKPVIQPLGAGLLKLNMLGENNVLFSEYTRYFNTTHGTVSSMAYDKNSKQLFVAGTFTQAGSVMVSNIAVWKETSSTWADVAGGLPSAYSISKMLMYGNNLVVVGTFSSIGNNLPVNNIAMFNIANNTWEPMGQGLASYQDMIVFNGQLIVAGMVNGRREGIGNSLLSVYVPSTRTFTPIPVSSTTPPSNCYQALTTPSCQVTLTSPRFSTANNRLYIRDGTNFYYFNGGYFELLINYPIIPVTGLIANTRLTFISNYLLVSPADDISSPFDDPNIRPLLAFTEGAVSVISSAVRFPVSFLMATMVFAVCSLLLI